ncbi:MAG: NADH-quinone oxidoreductase subunit NuoF [Endomicrobiaceae bacterium]|nr:NADH-quinone oxidoreductase subunit NuoF [Endomicrobiaceae bacterium]
MIDLNKITNDVKSASKNIRNRIILCAGTGCVANGALKVYDAFIKTAENMKLDICIEFKKESKGTLISKSGCQGFCQMGPLVSLMPENILYTKVQVEDVKEILEKSIIGNEIIDRLCYNENNKTYKGPEEIPFYKKQHRYIIKNCGFIGAEDIEEYISLGGYAGAKKACLEMTSEKICKEILSSGLRGRGGGGFPTGKKWELTKIQTEPKKYVICNGDEGDPGAFMNRSVLEGNPHSVIEGMIIASKAIGADEGYVYVRTEYHLAVERMKRAIKKAKEYGLLGNNLFGSNHNFELHVMEGAGAFVCGEETALIASVEGKRGMPKPKPPFPAQSGLWGKPTVINNVETLATVSLIIRDGAENYKKIGVPTSTGTKTFALTGHVKNTGLIEVPFGTTLRQIIDIAGGVTNDKGDVEEGAFKAVQIGGPSGGCLTKEHLDLPLDFDSLRSVGAMVGSGGLVVMNQTTCMVNIAKFFMQFTQNESCGKCVLCREGTRQMLLMLEDITEGRATEETIPLLEKLAHTVRIGSLCGLGKTAPNPVLSTLKYFRHEYDAHVKEKKCPSGSCTSLVNITINPEKCIGCTVCALKCPVKAIKGEKKEKHVIDRSICVKCGVCIDVCKFKAIKRG